MRLQAITCLPRWSYANLYTGPIDSGVKFTESWKAMEELVKEGKVKNIGVSNFNIEQIKEVREGDSSLHCDNGGYTTKYCHPFHVVALFLRTFFLYSDSSDCICSHLCQSGASLQF